MAIDRAGLVGDDGPTHHGAFDLAYLRMIPNVRVIAPSDEAELVNALHTALELEGPVALRYPRGEAMGASLTEAPQILPEGKSRVVREGDDAAILAFGCMVKQAKAAADILEEKGLSVRVVDMRWVKPLDIDAIRAAMETGCVLTVEDGALAGGAGSAVAEKMAAFGSAVRFRSLGLPDEFVPQGKQPQLYRELGIDGQGIAEAILQLSGKASVE
jgi:1-deoxy-D-xylulose-5-phosphate synthase